MTPISVVEVESFVSRKLATTTSVTGDGKTQTHTIGTSSYPCSILDKLTTSIANAFEWTENGYKENSDSQLTKWFGTTSSDSA